MRTRTFVSSALSPEPSGSHHCSRHSDICWLKKGGKPLSPGPAPAGEQSITGTVTLPGTLLPDHDIHQQFSRGLTGYTRSALPLQQESSLPVPLYDSARWQVYAAGLWAWGCRAAAGAAGLLGRPGLGRVPS